MNWLARPAPEAAPGFEAFVLARRAPMILMARGLVRHDGDAEDLVHEVLATALVKWRRVGASEDPAAYVNQMLVNAAISWFRRPARREQPAEQGAIDARRATTPLRDPAVDGAEREVVMAALRTLPVRHRAVLVLRYYEGMPDAEIAEILGMALPTVRSSAFRGLAALRRAGLRETTEPSPGHERRPSASAPPVPPARRLDPQASLEAP